MRSFDWTIFVCVVILCALGAAIIGSVSPNLLVPQVTFYLAGLTLFFVFSRLDYRLYPSLAKFVYVISLGLLFLTLIVGFESRGASRWFEIAGFRLQFSELLKPFLITVAATMLMAKSKGLRNLLLILAAAALPIFLVFKQPDLGSAVVYAFGFSVMIFASGFELRYLLSLITTAVIALPFSWHFLADYQKSRILTFLRPQFDPQGAGYNAIQALIAVGSGMFLGRGLGRGTQSHLLFLPEHHTDFVFAAAAEELGFVGAFTLLMVYFVLIARIFSLAAQSKDKRAYLICVGTGTILFVQVLINVGMNLGLFPVTGITLPLVSYGGSSILATLIGLGIVENIASLSKQDNSIKIGP